MIFQDSTIDFEKRRNIPVRYDRELVQTTVKAMKRIAEIKSRREHAFWKHRCVVFYHYLNTSVLTHLIFFQHVCCAGQAACSSSQEARVQNIRQTRSTSGGHTSQPGEGSRAREDQGVAEDTNSVNSWGRTVDGYGYRLTRPPFALSSILFSALLLSLSCGHSYVIRTCIARYSRVQIVQRLSSKALLHIALSLLVLRLCLLPNIRIKSIMDP
jgi:hypothetical protein